MVEHVIISYAFIAEPNEQFSKLYQITCLSHNYSANGRQGMQFIEILLNKEIYMVGGLKIAMQKFVCSKDCHLGSHFLIAQ